MRGASRPSSSIALTVSGVMAFAVGIAGVGGIVLAGPTADPMGFNSRIAASSSPATVVVSPSIAEVAGSFSATADLAGQPDAAPATVAPQPNLNVPEIPLPPILVPMAAGLIFVGRRIVAGRMPGPRLH